jgi:hypothetical protein
MVPGTSCLFTLFLTRGEDNHWREDGYMQKGEKALHIMLQPGVAGKLLLHGGLHLLKNRLAKLF